MAGRLLHVVSSDVLSPEFQAAFNALVDEVQALRVRVAELEGAPGAAGARIVLAPASGIPACNFADVSQPVPGKAVCAVWTFDGTDLRAGGDIEVFNMVPVIAGAWAGTGVPRLLQAKRIDHHPFVDVDPC